MVVDKSQILALHNKYRAEVGVPPLRWSDKLAYGAEQWAKAIAGLAQLQHSGTSGIGENLAFWKGSPASIGQMIAVWAAEKNVFTHGAFPQISRDGNWLSASHYSQMIWRTTTRSAVAPKQRQNGFPGVLVQSAGQLHRCGTLLGIRYLPSKKISQ